MSNSTNHFFFLLKTIVIGNINVIFKEFHERERENEIYGCKKIKAKQQTSIFLRLKDINDFSLIYMNA